MAGMLLHEANRRLGEAPNGGGGSPRAPRRRLGPADIRGVCVWGNHSNSQVFLFLFFYFGGGGGGSRFWAWPCGGVLWEGTDHTASLSTPRLALLVVCVGYEKSSRIPDDILGDVSPGTEQELRSHERKMRCLGRDKCATVVSYSPRPGLFTLSFFF